MKTDVEGTAAYTREVGPPHAAPTPPSHGGDGGGARWKFYGILLLLAVLLAIAIVFAVRGRKKEEDAAGKLATSEADFLPKIQTATVQRAKRPGTLEIPGTTTPLVEAYIYSRSSGYLQKRLVDIGDHVKAGQLLALVSAPDLDQQVEQAQAAVLQSKSVLNQQQAQLNLATLTWNRWKVLVAKGVFSRQDGDTQEANYRVALANVKAGEANVRSSEANLQRLRVLQDFERITAPFNGIITARNVDVGALISAQGSGLGFSTISAGGTEAAATTNSAGASGSVGSSAQPVTGGAQGGQLFTEAETDRLRILISVPEGYADQVRRGQIAKLQFQSGTDKTYEGHVTRVTDAIDVNTRTMLTEVQVANPNGKLKTGMYVVVSLDGMAVQPPLIVPGDAIVVRNDRNEVAVIDGGVVHFKPVDVGRDYGTVTEILSGLHQGETIAVDVTDDVKEGSKVQPVPTQDAADKATPPSHANAPNGQYGPESLANRSQNKGSGPAKGSSKSTPGKEGASK